MFGLPSPWIILGTVLTALALATGTFFYGRSVGIDKVESVWQAREAKINAEMAIAIQAAGAKTLAVERASAERIAAVSTTYQRKLKEKDREKATALAIAGGLRIGTTGPSSCGDTVSSTGSSPSGRDGETRSRLSQHSAEFLVGEASRADKVVEQLSACQTIIEKDRGVK